MEKNRKETKEEKQIEDKIAEDFKEDICAYKERKSEEKHAKQIEEDLKKHIEAEISEDFKENQKEYNRRKAEEEPNHLLKK